MTLIAARRVFAAALLVILPARCSPENHGTREGVLILAGATEVRSDRGFEADGVEYLLRDVNPGSIIRYIATTLYAKGWRPLSEQWSNPGQASSFVGGWNCWPVNGENITFQWMTDWRDGDGNVITYDLRSNDDPTLREKTDLEIRVSYIPRDAAKTAARLRHAGGIANLAISGECIRFIDGRRAERQTPVGNVNR